jgi:hypothetical protein
MRLLFCTLAFACLALLVSCSDLGSASAYPEEVYAPHCLFGGACTIIDSAGITGPTERQCRNWKGNVYPTESTCLAALYPSSSSQEPSFPSSSSFTPRSSSSQAFVVPSEPSSSSFEPEYPEEESSSSSEAPGSDVLSVEIGGTGALGSFVDLDLVPPVLYTSTTYKDHLDDIDLVYAVAFGGANGLYSTSQFQLLESQAAYDFYDYGTLYSYLSDENEEYPEYMPASAIGVPYLLETTEGRFFTVQVDSYSGTASLWLLMMEAY